MTRASHQVRLRPVRLREQKLGHAREHGWRCVLRAAHDGILSDQGCHRIGDDLYAGYRHVARDAPAQHRDQFRDALTRRRLLLNAGAQKAQAQAVRRRATEPEDAPSASALARCTSPQAQRRTDSKCPSALLSSNGVPIQRKATPSPKWAASHHSMSSSKTCVRCKKPTGHLSLEPMDVSRRTTPATARLRLLSIALPPKAVEFARCRSKFGPRVPEFGTSSTNIGQIGPESTRAVPSSTDVNQKTAKVDHWIEQSWLEFGPNRPTYARNRPDNMDNWSNIAAMEKQHSSNSEPAKLSNEAPAAPKLLAGYVTHLDRTDLEACGHEERAGNLVTAVIRFTELPAALFRNS